MNNPYRVTELIPQRPPMMMIDRLISVEAGHARGELQIRPDNLFCEKGILRESGMVEFIAQTAAAFTGYRNKTESRNVTEGYIGAIKNLVIHGLPPVGETITSEITVENEIVGYTIITGRVRKGEMILAECEMRILQGSAPQ